MNNGLLIFDKLYHNTYNATVNIKQKELVFMPIVLARIDDRLLHGQVATSWVRATNTQVIVVVDEFLPDDPVQVKVLKLAAPPAVKVYVMKPDKIAEKLKQGVLDNYNVMLIFAGVEAPMRLRQMGVKLDSINYGGMRFKEGRTQLNKTISMTDAERNISKEMSNTGIELEHRQLFSDTKIDITPML